MAQTTEINLVYFGDSLTDDGNAFDLTSTVLNTPYPPSELGYDERFTNGEVWAEKTAKLLGADTYVNYAIGGAEAVGEQTLEQYLIERELIGDVKDASLLGYDINLSGQVARFLADTAGADRSGMTASIMIGANDYRTFQPTDPTNPALVFAEASALMQSVVTSTIAAAVALLQNGVGEVVINTLPPAEFFPYLEQLPADYQYLSKTIIELQNDGLTAAAEALSASGANIRIVDLEALATEILLDPSSFGFIAPLADSVVVDMGGDAEAAGYDLDQVAFFDEVHPTTAGHGVIAAFNAANLTHDVIIAGTGDDSILGSADADLVLASVGNDTVSLFSGDDIALGGLGNDTINAGSGSDIVSGGSGNDVVGGGAGHDVIAGGDGNDVLRGGRGKDVLVDGLGSDEAYGGRGDDMFLFAEACLIGGNGGGSLDHFDGGSGYDTLYLALSEETRTGVEADLAGGATMTEALSEIGISIHSIEEVVFVDERVDLAALEADARIEEADLWGFV